MNIQLLEKQLISLLALIQSKEKNITDWTYEDNTMYQVMTDDYAGMLDDYANYCESNPHFNNRVNY